MSKEERQSIQKIRRRAIAGIRAAIAPYLKPSQWRDDTPQNGRLQIYRRHKKPRKPGGKRTEWRDFHLAEAQTETLHRFTALSLEGVIDAWGAGCLVTPFDSFCVEDLLRLESMVLKAVAEEIPEVKIEQQNSRYRAKSDVFSVSGFGEARPACRPSGHTAIQNQPTSGDAGKGENNA